MALAALERTGEVGLAIVVVDTLDLPKLPSRPLFPLLLVVVLALAPVEDVDTAADRGCRQAARVVEVLALVSVR